MLNVVEFYVCDMHNSVRLTENILFQLWKKARVSDMAKRGENAIKVYCIT
jgi:hypothetical protein